MQEQHDRLYSGFSIDAIHFSYLYSLNTIVFQVDSSNALHPLVQGAALHGLVYYCWIEAVWFFGACDVPCSRCFFLRWSCFRVTHS